MQSYLKFHGKKGNLFSKYLQVLVMFIISQCRVKLYPAYISQVESFKQLVMVKGRWNNKFVKKYKFGFNSLVMIKKWKDLPGERR